MYKARILAGLLLVATLAATAACGETTPTATPVPPTATAVVEKPTPMPAIDVPTVVGSFLTTLPDGFYAVGKIDALKDLISSGGALVVDVREVKDYAAGHIPGAVNIPIRELAKNLDKIPADKPVVFTCASGHRAAIALASAQILGYTNARSFPGSYKAWTDAKEAVSTDVVEAMSYGAPTANAVLISRVDGFLSALPDNFYAVSKVPDLKELMATGGATLVDLRPEDEYGEGHIPGAISIPIQQLARNLDKLPTDKPLVVSCASGHRAGMALAALQLLGYSNARSFPPSFNGWKAAGEAVEPPAEPDMQTIIDNYLTNLPDGYYNVKDVAALKDIIATGNFMLIDVREATDYAEGHIPGAVNIPIRELAKNLDKIPTDKPVVLSCASGLRCTIGTASLQILGYGNARTFYPSYKGWTAANETVSKDVVEAKVIGTPKVDAALLAKVDEFLSNLPDAYYSIGKVEALKELMTSGSVLVVDVRETTEYAEGHIPGAINIPIRELAKNLDKIRTDEPVVLTCASGLRCTLAMPALHLLGYTNVRTFPPSFNGWKAANEAIEK
jgi:rhodanese-related sulfurtransferase